MIGKRLFDIAIASVLALLFAPVILITACLVKYKLGSPILFQQTRPGLRGRAFKMVKFRSMRNAYNSNGVPLSDSQRLTRFGKFLRATSLDELPELWNVIKGDMSLVGPRPLLMEYLPLYSKEQSRRHEVLPGITGLAQVNGRNAISWSKKLELDVEYIDKKTFWLDCKILFLTFLKVLRRDGISSKEHATMAKFKGKS